MVVRGLHDGVYVAPCESVSKIAILAALAFLILSGFRLIVAV